jgi:hypothetical protein
MKHIWSILCQTSVRDQDTNRTSIINAMDVIGFIVDKEKLIEKKNIPVNLEIVSMWSNVGSNSEQFMVRIELKNTDKKILSKSELSVGQAGDKSKLNKTRSIITRMSINLLEVAVEGQYYFVVSQKNLTDKKFNIVAELPLEVKIKYQDNIVKNIE